MARAGQSTVGTGALGGAVAAAISTFGASVKVKLVGVGQPEDQLRGPLETMLASVGAALGLTVVPVGETPLTELGVRPDYAIQVNGAFCGYIEVKAPGKGADPTRWKSSTRDYKQWEKLRALPNVLYTDGNEWALYRSGELASPVIRLPGDVRTSDAALVADGDGELATLLSSFLTWAPITPTTLRQLVVSVAGLCRLLRGEVEDALRREKTKKGPFGRLAADWRELLFPDASDFEFADGYAQTVTFALLLARVDGIDFEGRNITDISRRLGKSHSLMGKALDILTDESVADLTVTLRTLVRVAGAVNWDLFAGVSQDLYLRLYEDFLEEYDPELRKQTGSYYTPKEIVDGMVRLTDEILRTRLDRPLGFASDDVVVVDPAMGTGAFLLQIIESAAQVFGDEGPGSVGPRLQQMTRNLVGLERQVGPFAVAEMRAIEAFHRHHAELPEEGMRLYVADTLENPNSQNAHIYASLEQIARSHVDANRFKREDEVVVVIGNPPYKDKSRDSGGWIVDRGETVAPLDAFRSPGNGRLEYVLSNMSVFFWRWATWKVFDAHPGAPTGVVAFITPGSYLAGPGFRGMREYLRRTADEGWIIDLTPEGHQPDVSTRPFPEVQQPLAIGIFARTSPPDDAPGTARPPARLSFLALHGHRDVKFQELTNLTLSDPRWQPCVSGWGDPFLPSRGESWESLPAMPDLMPWSSPGVKTERSWVIALDKTTLANRWAALLEGDSQSDRDTLLKVTRNRSVLSRPEYLPGFGPVGERMRPLRDEPEDAPCPPILPYGHRTLDRKYIVADHRLMYPARPDLWGVRGGEQLFVAEQHAEPITSGPALTFSAYLPDMHYFNGRGGRAFPLHRDGDGASPNVAPGLLTHLTQTWQTAVSARDLVAYLAGVLSHSGYTRRFAAQLATPGVRVPLTADPESYRRAADLGRQVIWLHTYGERAVDPAAGRPAAVPRLPDDRRPLVVHGITGPEMPKEFNYDPATETLHIGTGQIRPVPPAVWDYELSDWQVVRRWLRYRLGIGGKRSSELDDIRPKAWLPDFTTELLNLLNIVGRLVDVEGAQDELLGTIVDGPLVTVADLQAAGVLPLSASVRGPRIGGVQQDELFGS
ncbi:type ISP restriction/modification enzyme [Parafrankia elaeagni]|uniref:type ISP restriction/modification enzyme n=1 Tax=Parafrankia elaeagni TaxID=222534 RepID=UPI0007C879CF|nr:type ISP restriction/modification enzyme [Parafrankia elaeagni]